MPPRGGSGGGQDAGSSGGSGGAGGTGGTAGGSGAGGAGGSGGAGGMGGGGAGGGGAGGGGTDGGGAGAGGSGGAPDGGPPPSDKKPDCSRYYGTFAAPDPHETAGDMWCYVNSNRDRYSIHGRNSGCGWGAKKGSGVSWPYEMAWAPDLMAKAQKEAERVSAGGSPKGSGQTDGSTVAKPLYLSGCASSEYMVTSPDDDPTTDWEDTYLDMPGGDGYCYECQSRSLSTANGTARMSVHYYDPGSGYPVLKRLGVGLAKKGKIRTWVLVFGP